MARAARSFVQLPASAAPMPPLPPQPPAKPSPPALLSWLQSRGEAIGTLGAATERAGDKNGCLTKGHPRPCQRGLAGRYEPTI